MHFVPHLLSRGFLWLGFAVVCIGTATPATAQMFAYEPDRPRPVTTVSVGYHIIDFTYNGDGTPGTRFDFAEPVYALRYTRSNLDITIAYGWRASDADGGSSRFGEATFFAWSGFLLTPRSNTRIYLPLSLHSGYRAVGATLRESTTADLFNFTSLALGSGLILERRFGRNVNLQARALPFIGLALRSFEGFAGNTRLFDGDAQLEFKRLFGRFGLTLGYGFRGQGWNVDASRFTQSISEDWFDYKSRQHMLRIGVNW